MLVIDKATGNGMWVKARNAFFLTGQAYYLVCRNPA